MFSCLRQPKGFYSKLWKLALPLILQNLVTNSLGLIDTFMVGSLPGDIPMAAVTLANIPIFVVILLIFGLQSGAAVLISQFWGRGDTDSINRVLGIGLYAAGIVSVLFAIITLFFPTEFMGLFTDNPDLIPTAASYIRIVGISYLFNSITQVYIGAHRSMENPKLGLGILSVSMCSNTFLNWVLIFGNLGAPALGVMGAAYATLSSRILEFLVMIICASRSKRFSLRFSLLLRPGLPLLRAYVRYATPVIINETLWGMGTALFPTILGHMDASTEILAAYALSGNIDRLIIVAIFALAATSATVVGREIGAGRSSTVYQMGFALNLVSVSCGVVLAVLALLLSHFILVPIVYPSFGLSVMAQDVATMMLTVISIILPVRAFNFTNIVGVLRGGGDVHAATFIDLSPLWFIALPLSALAGLVLHLDIMWVFIFYCSEQVFKFFMGVFRFRSGKWVNDITHTH